MVSGEMKTQGEEMETQRHRGHGESHTRSTSVLSVPLCFQRQEGQPTLQAEKLDATICKRVEVLDYIAMGPPPVAQLDDSTNGPPPVASLGDEEQIPPALILYQDRNQVVAEYALRGIAKPIGVSESELTRVLPTELKSSLPTIEQIESELSKEMESES